ncbi:hypothetical protein Hanom_Chr15g01404551 [Helianthus anomalus]
MSGKNPAQYLAYMFYLILLLKGFKSYSLYADGSKVPIFLDLEELDSYSTPVNVKKEAPTVTSSKLFTTPKPNPRTRASTSKMRKGSETTTPASKGFSYEELSFTESL